MRKPVLIWSRKNYIFQLWSAYCTAKSLCREKEICCHPQGILFAETVFLPAIPPCLCLGDNYKYFLNTLSHANSFPHECTNPTFGYALSGQEATQKQEHIKARVFLRYSLVKGRKQLGILHAKAVHPAWIFIMKCHYETVWSMNIQYVFLFEVVN